MGDLEPNTVSKLRASDGKILGSSTVGSAPWWRNPLTGDIWRADQRRRDQVADQRR